MVGPVPVGLTGLGKGGLQRQECPSCPGGLRARSLADAYHLGWACQGLCSIQPRAWRKHRGCPQGHEHAAGLCSSSCAPGRALPGEARCSIGALQEQGKGFPWPGQPAGIVSMAAAAVGRRENTAVLGMGQGLHPPHACAHRKLLWEQSSDPLGESSGLLLSSRRGSIHVPPTPTHPGHCPPWPVAPRLFAPLPFLSSSYNLRLPPPPSKANSPIPAQFG